MKFFNDYFVFSVSEKRGIFAFLIVIVLMSISYRVIPYFFSPDPTDFSEFENQLASQTKTENSKKKAELFSFNPNTISKDSLLSLGLTPRQASNVVNYRDKVGGFKNKGDFKKIYSINDSLFEVLSPLLKFNSKRKKIESQESIVTKKDSLFAFDPNTASKEELVLLGFKEKQAGTLINYRNKGGKFYKPEDMKKVYSVSDKTYEKLATFIEIKKETKPNLKPRTQFDQKRVTIDINQDNAESFQNISGIGAKLSERIIKYRDKIGGFYSVNQLKEVYGIDSNLINTNFQSFVVSARSVKQININTVTFKELLAHPYFTYGATQKIINFREQHGEFKTVEEILENNLINLEQYRKIVSYIILK